MVLLFWYLFPKRVIFLQRLHRRGASLEVIPYLRLFVWNNSTTREPIMINCFLIGEFNEKLSSSQCKVVKKMSIIFAVTVYCWPHVTARQPQNGRVQTLIFRSSTAICLYVRVLSNVTRIIFALAKNALYSVELLCKSCAKVKPNVILLVN